jgi:hypothetical protein
MIRRKSGRVDLHSYQMPTESQGLYRDKWCGLICCCCCVGRVQASKPYLHITTNNRFHSSPVFLIANFVSVTLQLLQYISACISIETRRWRWELWGMNSIWFTFVASTSQRMPESHPLKGGVLSLCRRVLCQESSPRERGYTIEAMAPIVLCVFLGSTSTQFSCEKGLLSSECCWEGAKQWPAIAGSL